MNFSLKKTGGQTLCTNMKHRGQTLLCLLIVIAITFGSACALSGCSRQSVTSTRTNETAGIVSGSENEYGNTIEFVDSAGRKTRIPKNIERVVPSGHVATMVLLAFEPKKLVSAGTSVDEKSLSYYADAEYIKSLPATGAVFGGKGDLNKEEIANLNPQILIDVGEPKDGIADDLDELQKQLGIPCIFISASLDDYASTFNLLGQIFGEQMRADELAKFATNTYQQAKDAKASSTNVPKIANIVGTDGVNAIAKGTYQSGVIDVVAENAIVVENAVNKGTGNAIDLEQLNNFDPDILFFQDEEVLNTALTEQGWKSLSAIQAGKVYLVPDEPYCWLNNPPLVNQILGLTWLSHLLYPDQFDDSVEDAVKSFFSTFYGKTLDDSQVSDLLYRAR